MPSPRPLTGTSGGLDFDVVLPQSHPRCRDEEPPSGGEGDWPPRGAPGGGGVREDAGAAGPHRDASRSVEGLRGPRHRRRICGMQMLSGPQGVVDLLVGSRGEMGGWPPDAQLLDVLWDHKGW